MPEDFKHMERLAVVCDMDEFIPGADSRPDSDEIMKKFDDIMPMQELYRLKIISVDEDNDNKVDIPEVRQKIKAAGLIESLL